MHIKLKIVVLALLAGLGETCIAQMQAGLGLWRPMAIVNDEAITAYEVRQRSALDLISRGQVPSKEKIDLMRERTLDVLVEDTLKLQAAKKDGIKVNEAEVEEILQRIAKSGGGTIEALSAELLRNGASLSVLERQLRARLAFQEVVRQRVRRKGIITEEDVQAKLEQRTLRVGQNERKVSEILITVDATRSPEDVLRLAQRIVGQLRSGQRSFSRLAEEFSDSASGAAGGRLGWLFPGELPPALDSVMQALTKGQISDPIITNDGVYILGVEDLRVVGERDEGPAWTVKQLFIRLSSDISGTEVQFKLARLTRIAAQSKGCDAFNEAMVSMGDKGSGDLEEINPETLPAQVYQALEETGKGVSTQPIAVTNGVAIFMLCSTKRRTTELEEQQIRAEILQERVAQFADRTLRQLRQEAFIDIRK